MDGSVLYLSAEAVERVGLPPDALRDAVAAAFLAQTRGTTRAVPKVTLPIAPGHFFQAMPASLLAPGIAGMKWVGIVPAANARGGPTITALILLCDLATGVPVALVEATAITARRTAAMTALAAQRLARRDAASIGFIGCGVQARSHLEALRRVLPRLARVVAYSRSGKSAAEFASFAEGAGLAAEAVTEPRRAVAGLDLVVTSVPAAAGLVPFVDPAWLAPGAFASAVDLGRSWLPAGMRAIEIIATDEHAQSEALAEAGKLAFPGPFDADLGELLAGAKPGRRREEERCLFLFAGHALADLAAAHAVYEAARQAGIGLCLPH